ISLLRGNTSEKHLEFSASITLRYSDAPKNVNSIIIVQKKNKKDEIETISAQESSYIKNRL
ncbi:MAG: tRNA (5-methylaminomethyl-2-thiouridylate)-methyltransferase, partial [Nitrosopumilaceae archaeon]